MDNTLTEQTKISAADLLKREKANPTWEKIRIFFLGMGRVPLKEKLFFLQHLSVMVRSGISLLVAFRTLSEQTENKTFSRILKEVALKIEQGGSLTESLKPYPNVFNELFINMIASGEVSGKLEEVFKQLYLQIKKQHELNSKIKSALTYPAVIIVIMSLIGVFMMIYVIPKILDVFKDYKATLPLPTKILIFVSNLIVEHGILVGIVSVLTILILVKVLKTEKGKYLFQALLLRMPIISPILKKINLARFARTTSSLLKTDIMIIETFRITANVLSNLHYRKAVMEIGERIKKGGQVSDTIKNYPKFFPPIVTQMIVVGEQTGEMSSILSELAEFYEGEVDQIMENLPSLIEPLLILVLGCAVGGMAMAVIMPMYALTSAI